MAKSGIQFIKDKIQSYGQEKASKNQTIRLLRAIGSPFTSAKADSSAETQEQYDLAYKNKIPLLYLDTLKQQGKLKELEPEYREHCDRYDTFLRVLAKSAKTLEAAHIEYVAFKSVRPYRAVPGDIDIIIYGDGNVYDQACDAFLRQDYKEAVSDGPTPTRGDLMDFKENVPLDLQVELRLSHIVYMDKENFRKDIVEARLPGGGGVRILNPEYDLATVIIHSISEQLYILGEYYTFLHRLVQMDDRQRSRFVDVLKKNRIKSAARAHLTITATLCQAAYGAIPDKLERLLDEIGVERSTVSRVVKSDFEMPQRYGIRATARVGLEKMKEKKFRRSVGSQFVHMLDPRMAVFVISKGLERRRRKYYIKDYVKKKIKFKE